ncbi:MAG: hypothetical protein LBM96_08810 [Methanobrevibacter sp.]|jgi:hypothetical protein|nr:hypothetical protein [Candidatus Methanoflexus mossambicus]
MSIVVDNPNILKSIRRIAKRENKSEDKVLEDIIERGLKSTEPQIPEHLISNKDTYNPNMTKEELNSFVGIADAPKGFDVVKAVEDVVSGKHD